MSNSTLFFVDEPGDSHLIRHNGSKPDSQGYESFVYTLFLLLWLCTTPVGATSPIHRLNYGAVFEPIGRMHASSDYWRHTFRINLPEIPELPPMPAPCQQVDRTDLIVSCQMLFEAYNATEKLKLSAITALTKIRQSMMNTVPQIFTPDQGSRSTRSILPFIGQLSKSLCGTATQHDVAVLAQHINSLESRTRGLSNSFEHEGASLVSFMDTVNKRISLSVTAVKDNHQAITKLAHDYDLLSNSMVLGTSIAVLLSQHTIQTAQFIQQANQFLASVQQLRGGSISSTLLPPEALSHAIAQVKAKLNMYYPNFQITHPQNDYYYASPQFLFARKHLSLYLTIKIPIHTVPTPFQVYQIALFPVPANSSSNHATLLTDIPQYWAISLDNQHFSPLTQSQWETCSGPPMLKNCPFQLPLRPASNPSCTSSLFFQQKTHIKTNCKFHFIPNVVKPDVHPLSDGTIIITNISHLTLHCSQQIHTVPGCQFCSMRIPCQCSIKTDYVHLPQTLHNCQGNSTSVSLLHPLNLALVQHFFEDKLFDYVQGNSLFRKPINPAMPPINLFSHNLSKYVANDEELRLNLDNVVKAAKANQVTLQRLSEPILAGWLPTDDDLFQTCTNIFTYVALGLSLLACMLAAITLRKLKTALLALAAAQQVATAQSASVPPQFIIPTSSSPLTTTPHAVQQPLIFTVVSISPITLCLVFCMLCYLIRHIRKISYTSFRN